MFFAVPRISLMCKLCVPVLTPVAALRPHLKNGADDVPEGIGLQAQFVGGLQHEKVQILRLILNGRTKNSVQRGNDSMSGFEATLWAAADKLRGNVDAAEQARSPRLDLPRIYL